MVFYERHLCRIVPFPEELQRTFAQLEADPTVYHTMNRTERVSRDRNAPRLGCRRPSRRDRRARLVISGEHDEATPTVVKPVVEGLRDATWELVDGASHSTHLERPERFLELVTAFLASHD